MIRESSAPAKLTLLMRPVCECAVEAEPKRRRVCAVDTSQRRTARSPPAEQKVALVEEMARERTE
jgi:hypothetical protein